MLNRRTYLLCVFMLLHSTFVLAGKALDYEECIRLLSTPTDADFQNYDRVFWTFDGRDTDIVMSRLNELESKGKFANHYFKARFTCIKVFYMAVLRQYQSKAQLIMMNEKALNEAYETADEPFVAFISYKCGSNSLEFEHMELAATYLLKGQEIYDRLSIPAKQENGSLVLLGEVMFQSHEYERSIFYTHRAIETSSPKLDTIFFARFYNTIGQDYEMLGKVDSAMKYYNESLLYCIGHNSDVWKAINFGYIGDLYFKSREYEKAKPLLQYSYAVNKTKETDHAAKSLQTLAAIDLIEGKSDSALAKIKEALQLINKFSSGYYLQPLSYLERIYLTTSDIYRTMDKSDSFYLYNRLYSQLHDSLQEVALMISTKIARLRIDSDNNLRGIQMLQKEKQTADMKRNFAILFILLLSVIVFLFLNRRMMKQKHKQQFAIQEKNAAEVELTAARELMQHFTQNIIEKTELIEKLKEQISQQELTFEQQQLINDLTHQTILTEDEWQNFKSLFEKIYPGFFINLKNKARDITLAEQRMAALTRLNLTTRQMASMLGISVDSVHKARQRLRQRLQVSTEVDLEESVASL